MVYRYFRFCKSGYLSRNNFATNKKGRSNHGLASPYSGKDPSESYQHLRSTFSSSEFFLIEIGAEKGSCKT